MRARITALVLVNWKGVFYERYLFDRHVTALEGANGAGKTTVMIGAYVALLPDMSKLRFTNLGETAATGGDRGIYGRLGEPGRPSYTVLELDVAGARILAGVRLTRMTEPTVEPTAFMIRGLTPGVPLSELFLVRELDGDHVPELDDIRKAVEAAGAQLETFRAIKDYFAAMFDAGITPMRLAGDEERSKLNEMLRTSMTGGISRALTSELRGFLLREETGLSDTLTHMRANLDACARTRTEVAEARGLEREISAIYQAGLDMFAAAVHAARAAAEEAERDVERARPALDGAVRHERGLGDHLATLEARRAVVDARVVSAREGVAILAAERDRAVAAEAVAVRLVELEQELAGFDGATRAQLATATANRTAARAERTRAYAALERAAHGLADLQAGLDELVRRAHGHRQLVKRLEDARRLTGHEVSIEDAAAMLGELDAQRDKLETERARLARDTRELASRREEYAKAMTALEAFDPDGSGQRIQRARRALAKLTDLEALLGRSAELTREHDEAARLAARQTKARGLAGELDAVDVAAELATAEEVLRTMAAAASERREQGAVDRRRDEDIRGALAVLDERNARWQIASATVAQLAARGAAAPTTRAGLAAARESVAKESHALVARRGQVEANREELAQRAAALGRGGASLDPELVRLRDELGGELLAARFEDLELAQAAWVEARLGPLTQAILVDDLELAANAVMKLERTAGTVHLVGPDAVLAVEPPEDPEDDVLTVEPYGMRVTKTVPRPSLGRRARERQLRELQEAIARDGRSLDELSLRANELAALRRDHDTLDGCIDALAAGDPAVERSQLVAEMAAIAKRQAARDDENFARRERELRTRADGLRRLLPDASLLGPPDFTQRAAELTTQLASLSAIAEELARVAPHRATLTAHLDALREAPDDTVLATTATRIEEIEARLDTLAIARVALADVLVHRHAANDGDAETALSERVLLAPALEQQHADAKAAVDASAASEAEAEATWEQATSVAQADEARRLAVLAHRDRAAGELAILRPVEIDLLALTARLTSLASDAAALDGERAELVAQHAVSTERLANAGRAVEIARTVLAAATRDAGPTVDAWTALRDRASAEGVLHAALMHVDRRSSVELAADAWSKREVLIDRAARARDGAELVEQMRAQPLEGGGYLACWVAARGWLRKRVPAQVAEVDEPLLALERLRDHLDVLEHRLARQELDLRGASEDVARGIDVLVRRAHGQVRRLNTQLEGIAFGNIHAMRVEIRRIDRMDQILRALRLGEAQELLFVANVPIEEALDEIFRRYGGGGRAGAQKLLDYREYVELVVEIKRKAATEWELASPTKLSTGEAIGVGAALMMVVLTEWERDANLLRARRTAGSLRFLFLDEANRLSRDNLAVLFDLCKTLDLQLLIAAPEVAKAEGNTTYRLVRHVTDDGREEVIVSGRRAVVNP